MNHLTPEQLKWCEKHLPEGKWKVNSQGLVDVEGDVNFSNRKFRKLPVPFGRVNGDFDLDGCKQLMTLDGSPREVSGYFDCKGCISLETLEGSPWEVGGWFSCLGCTRLQTLEGAPQRIGSWFNCMGCTSLQSLEGAPQSIGTSFFSKGCTSLPEWVHELAKEFNERKIFWEELLELHEKFLQKPKLGQAKNLGLI